MVGTDDTTSPNFSLQRIVVFPAASRPNMSALSSFFPKSESKSLVKLSPILNYEIYYIPLDKYKNLTGKKIIGNGQNHRLISSQSQEEKNLWNLQCTELVHNISRIKLLCDVCLDWLMAEYVYRLERISNLQVNSKILQPFRSSILNSMVGLIKWYQIRNSSCKFEFSTPLLEILKLAFK